MVNVLLKKQLFEIFRSYFYDAKKNRPRSRASTILFFVLYAVLMIGFVGGMFVLLAWSICQPLVASGMGWLYFTLFAGLAILLGVFGSVFNTFSSLYQAKDNDLLLSMPIPIRAILASRLLGVYLMGLMFSGVVLLPAVIFYWCAADVSPSAIAGGVMLVLAVSLFVLVLSCVLGWVVAKISAKLKRKNFLTVFIALVFFGLYYMVCFRASDLLNELLANLTAVGDAVRGAAYPLYLLGRMGEGDWLAIAFVMAVTLALCALTYLVLSRTFIGIATASGTTAKAEYREKAVKAAGASSALLRKEFGRFTSTVQSPSTASGNVARLPSSAPCTLSVSFTWGRTFSAVSPGTHPPTFRSVSVAWYNTHSGCLVYKSISTSSIAAILRCHRGSSSAAAPPFPFPAGKAMVRCDTSA